MKNNDIEKKINGAVNRAAPNDAEGVINDVKNGARADDAAVEAKSRSKRPRVYRWAGAIAAALVLVLGLTVAIGAYAGGGRKVASVVSLDVNPGIEISVNKNERVIEVKALNRDAEIVIGDMDFSGSTLDVTVNALVGAMLREGYLSDIANSILVSVDGGDAAYAERLKTRVTELIGAMFDGAVLAQTVTPDSDLDALAEQYGITKGKARLISEIMAAETANGGRIHTFAELAALSINELNLLRRGDGESGGASAIVSTGTPSAGAYISPEQALDAALADAGVPKDKATVIKQPRIDYEHGVMVYELEFTYDDGEIVYEYEYDVDALTGAIIDMERDATGKQPPTTQPPTGMGITEAEAKAKALAHAGVNESEITGYKCIRDRDDGVDVYEIEFYANNNEYDYEIAVATGEIIKSDVERHATSQPPTGTGITEAEAKAKALAHAGVNESEITGYKCIRDMEDGIDVYEIEFKSGGYEYEYDVNAATGAIVKQKRERDDDYTPPTKPSGTDGSGAAVSMEQARAIVLAHAGLTEADIRGYKCERDRDDGVDMYEIEFKSGGYEYEYDVNAATGSIIKFKREHDD